MARPKNPGRKAELMEQIISHLQDKPLSTVTFRDLAGALGVSAYTLVYHFGTREQLLNQIAETIEALSLELTPENAASWSRHQYQQWSDECWRWVVQERVRQLRRLGFEAAMQDLVAPVPTGIAQKYFAHWHSLHCAWLTAQGLPPDEAEILARLMVNSFYGLAYDVVINDDADAATEAFEGMMRDFWRDLDERLGA